MPIGTFFANAPSPLPHPFPPASKQAAIAAGAAEKARELKIQIDAAAGALLDEVAAM